MKFQDGRTQKSVFPPFLLNNNYFLNTTKNTKTKAPQTTFVTKILASWDINLKSCEDLKISCLVNSTPKNVGVFFTIISSKTLHNRVYLYKIMTGVESTVRGM